MKTEIKQKRKDLLKRIDRLELQRCQDCKGANIDYQSIWCKCPAAVKIRELGKQMNNLVRERSFDDTAGRKSYDPEMVKLAKSNSIGYKIFQQRIKVLGWTELRAATEPVRRMKIEE